MTDFNAYLEKFNQLPPEALLLLFVFILFYLLRAWPKFPNDMLKPVIFILGGFLYLGTSYGLTVIFLKGCVMTGFILIFHHYLWGRLEKLVLSFLASKVPKKSVPQVANLLGEEGDTAYLTKDRKHKPKAKP